MITTKVYARPGTDYFSSAVPKAIGEYLQLKQGDILVWEFDNRQLKKRKMTCISKGSGDELNDEGVEE